jgi:hypothetical protein
VDLFSKRRKRRGRVAVGDGQHGARDDSFDGETFGFNCDHSVFFAEEPSVAPSHRYFDAESRYLCSLPCLERNCPTTSFAQANTATSTTFSGHVVQG